MSAIGRKRGASLAHICLALGVLMLTNQLVFAQSGRPTWWSKTLKSEISFKIREPKHLTRDYFNKAITVVYLEHPAFKKLSRYSNAKNVRWLLSQGYRVIELDYRHHPKAVSPGINADIIAINDAIAAGDFCGLADCSTYQSYVLFEGYRISRNVAYFKDDPAVYNTPKEYIDGDTLRMDIVYPARSGKKVPVILSFSYSNSYPTFDSDAQKLTGLNKNQRLNLGYTLAGFDDAVLEGAPARGMAWAIADHPKYCPWGKGKPVGGKNDAFKSFQDNPDAARKVKSAIRTLRAQGANFDLSGKIGIFGFSRGSTAGAMALGNRPNKAIDTAGFYTTEPDEIQAAVLGPGVFDYTLIYDASDDGDANLELRCPWVWGDLEDNRELWETKGASFFLQKDAAPTLFFYNRDDEAYYQDQVRHLQAKMDKLGLVNKTMIDYGHGHAIPQSEGQLKTLYDFWSLYLIKGN